jgi:predicted ABC-type exoprotein transport system permease subunit
MIASSLTKNQGIYRMGAVFRRVQKMREREKERKEEE